jgi:hypothetical protein
MKNVLQEETDNFDRFLEAMARVLGTSKKQLESILYQQEKKDARQVRKSEITKRSHSRLSPMNPS